MSIDDLIENDDSFETRALTDFDDSLLRHGFNLDKSWKTRIYNIYYKWRYSHCITKRDA